MSSPHDVIDVVIYRKQKLQQIAGVGLERSSLLEQVEFFGAADGRPAIVDP